MEQELHKVDEPAWYCLRTQPKREHLAAVSIDRLDGVKSFCPRIQYKKATRRGKVWWTEAMFPGYIFAFFSRRENERNIIHTQGILKLLKFGEHVPEVPASLVLDLINELEKSAATEDDIMLLEPTVAVGDEVEFAQGAFQGVQGEVVEVLPALERVRLLVEFLGDNQVVDADLYSLLLPNKPLPDA